MISKRLRSCALQQLVVAWAKVVAVPACSRRLDEAVADWAMVEDPLSQEHLAHPIRANQRASQNLGMREALMGVVKVEGLEVLVAAKVAMAVVA